MRLHQGVQESEFYDMTVNEIGTGRNQPAHAQQVAQAVVNDTIRSGAKPVDAHVGFASLGKFGRHRQNVERDYECWQKNMRKQMNCSLEFYNVRLTIHNPNGHGEIPVMWQCFAPHELFALLHEHPNPEVWPNCVTGPCGELMAFWKHVRNHAWFKEGPAANFDDDELEKLVPMGLHGDDVQTFKKSATYKVLVLQINFILAKVENLLTHYILLIMAMTAFVKGKTMDEFWEFFNWSMWHLWKGFWPWMRWDKQNFTKADGYRFSKRGQPLASGHKGLLSQVRGDLPFIYMIFHWATFYHANFMCHECLASRVLRELIFTDFAENPCWLPTIISHANYMANTSRETRSKLCECIGWRMKIVFSDEMHDVNLGLQGYFNRSVCHEMSDEMAAADRRATKDDALKQLWLDFKAWKKAHKLKSSTPTLTKNMIGKATQSTTFPEMKLGATGLKNNSK